VCALIGGLALWSVGCNDGGGGTGGPGTGTGTATGTGTGTATGTGTGTGGETDGAPDYPEPGEGTDEIGGLADPAFVAPVPRSIGSGLPYDVRVQLGEDPGIVSAAADFDWQFARVLDEGTAAGSRARGLAHLGFFPLQVEVRGAQVSEVGPSQAWALSYEDDGLYMLDADGVFRTEQTVSLYAPALEPIVFGTVLGESFESYHPLVSEGLRPLTVSLFTAPIEGTTEVTFGHAMTWVLDGNPSPWEVAYLPEGAMEGRIAELAAEGFRPLSMSGRMGANPDEPPMLAAVFIADAIDPADTQAHLGVDVGGLQALAQDLSAQVPYSLVSRGGAPVFDVLTAQRAPQQGAVMEVGLSTDALRIVDRARRKAGFHLVTATSYGPPQEVRWAGVWQRYDAVDRRLREPDVEDWGPWSEAEEKVVALSQGGLDRRTPNQQMAVLEGGALAYRGAYTYGPVTWPQVRHESALPVGSLSKSLVAAVVVQALADEGLDLDTPLVDVLGWDPGTFTDGMSDPDGKDPDYSGIGVVTIREMLVHRAGFTGDGEITHTRGWEEVYRDHLTEQAHLAGIGAAPEVRRLPLSTDALEAWMLGVMTGAIELPEDPKTMRHAAIWDAGYKTVGAQYSNPTYSILGLVADRVAPGGLLGAVRAYAAAAGADASLWPVNDTRLPRRGLWHPIRHVPRMHLGVQGSPYRPVSPFPEVEPVFGEEDPFNIVRTQASEWPRLAVPRAPLRVHEDTYSAQYSVRGQSLGAGGFEGSATDVARLFRALVVGASQGGVLDDAVAVALRTIDPAGDPDFPGGLCDWCDGYGLGVYLYRNWVMGVGVVGGMGSLAAHNVAHDVTFVWIGDVAGTYPLSIFDDAFFDALEDTWPCQDDPQTPRDECEKDIVILPPWEKAP